MQIQFVIWAVALLASIHLVWRMANEYHHFLFEQWRRQMRARERKRAREQAKQRLLERRLEATSGLRRSPEELAARKKVIMQQVESTLGTKRPAPGRAPAAKKA